MLLPLPFLIIVDIDTFYVFVADGFVDSVHSDAVLIAAVVDSAVCTLIISCSHCLWCLLLLSLLLFMLLFLICCSRHQCCCQILILLILDVDNVVTAAAI